MKNFIKNQNSYFFFFFFGETKFLLKQQKKKKDKKELHLAFDSSILSLSLSLVEV